MAVRINLKGVAGIAGESIRARVYQPRSVTITVTGGPAGGTFTVAVTAGGSTQTTAGVAYNAAAATVQTAIQGLSNVGAGNAIVTGAGGGPWTVTLAASLVPFSVATSGAGLTGGTSPAAITADAAAIDFALSEFPVGSGQFRGAVSATLIDDSNDPYEIEARQVSAQTGAAFDASIALRLMRGDYGYLVNGAWTSEPLVKLKTDQITFSVAGRVDVTTSNPAIIRNVTIG